MSRCVRIAAPLLVTSLVIGPVVVLTGSAQAAVPSATCTVTKSVTEGKFDVAGKDLTPGATVTLRGGGGNRVSATADTTGKVSVKGVFPASGVVTLEEKATTQQNNNQNQNKQNQNKQNQSKGTRISCGTAAQAQEQGAQQQLSKGFAQGFADTKKACTAKAPQQGLAPLDPNFEKGYKQGSDAAINSKFCQDKLNQ